MVQKALKNSSADLQTSDFDALDMFHISQGRFCCCIFLEIDRTLVIQKVLSKYFKFYSV